MSRGRTLPKASALERLSLIAKRVFKIQSENPDLTQSELGTMVKRTPRQIGTITRSSLYRQAMLECLDIPEEYLRRIAPKALRLLTRQVEEGFPRKLANGETIDPTEDQKESSRAAATTLAKLAISRKVILEGGENALKIQTAPAVFEWVAPTEGGPTAEDVGGKKRGNPRKPKPKEK